MKKILTFIPSLFLALISWAGVGPEVKFINETHDFGAFDENDGVVKCRFQYVNIGDEPLTVVASRATCGCTSSSYTKTPVEPGDTGYVEVSYNPTGRPGRFAKKVYIDFNTEHPRYTLLIKGVVIGSSNTLRGRYPVDAGPLKFRSDNILLGEVQNGKSKSAFFEAYNATPDTISPEWLYIPEGVKINTSIPAVPPGEQATYTVYFVPEKDMYGIYTDSLVIQATPHDEPSSVSVIAIIEEDFSRLTPGQLRDAPLIQLDTKVVDLGSISRNAGPVTTSFTFRNTGKDNMLIRRVYTTDSGITVSTDSDKLKKGKEATVNVTIDPLSLSSEILNGRISIIVNDPVHPTSVVRVVGELVD
ncbi:MAG: DUF1573 domain-containing protein [Muribaculaceae bacterium]|nr:DUF1573 domain-containing protein [Muribaculaceae bacterium]